MTKGNTLIDIGTDHGYIPIALVLSGQIPFAIAADIRTGPLQRAKEHIEKEQVSNQVKTRLSDGLAAIKKEELTPNTTVLIAGMGGPLIVRILEEAEEKLQEVGEIILSPQSMPALVRHYLADHGYCIIQEEMVWDGKYYPIFKLDHGFMAYDRELFYRYGKQLLEIKHPVLEQYLKTEKEARKRVLDSLIHSEKSPERQLEIRQEIQQIEEAQAFYQE